MAMNLSEAVNQLIHDKNMSVELVKKTIESTLLAAYKRKFVKKNKEAKKEVYETKKETCENDVIETNAVVRIDEDTWTVSIFAKKKISPEIQDPVLEISLEEAQKLNPSAELGDEILIEVDPKEFDRLSVQSGKQTAKQSIREIQKDTFYSEYKTKEGELVIGYYQREKNGNIYVNLGKIEGILPKKFQSPREVYHLNDRIKALIYEVNKTSSSLQIVLSRTHTEFVRAIFEIEVPEVYDKVVEIHKIVREPGYRTKIAVFSNRDADVDPVGACVGLKGVRIQTIIKELEGEKIDILKYDPDPKQFIKNALSPAEVRGVSIIDEQKRQALAIVNDSQLSLAIGKQGLNVKLANRLVDWNIDVKTDDQVKDMDIHLESRRQVSELFGESYEEEEFSKISELPGVDKVVAEKLLENGIDFIEDFIMLTPEERVKIDVVSAEQFEQLQKLIEEYVEIVEEEEEASQANNAEMSGEEEIEEYECPECGAKITTDIENCPKCGIGLSFEYEE